MVENVDAGKKGGKIEQTRHARESTKLDPKFEKALAEEGMSEELNEWPEY
jgi:hypothetical protein